MKKTFAILLAAVLVATALCACLTVSAEGKNLAQGKTVTGANPTSGGITDKYNASIVDGNASNSVDLENAPGDWFCFYYNASPDYPSNATHDGTNAIGAFVVDLGAAASVGSVRIHMVTDDTYGALGVKPPQSIKVEVSSDNKTWTAFGTTDDFSSYETVDWVEIKGSAAANARYVRVTITYEGYTLLLNEVQVIEGGAASGGDKTDTDTNSPSTTTPSTSTPSSSTGPAAGDAGLIGFAVLAVAAISGLAVAVKVRR